MRILILHQYYCPPGGWGNDRSFDWASQWAAAGHEVEVLTTQAYFPPAQRSSRPLRLDVAGHRVLALPVAYEQRMGWLRRSWAFISFLGRGLVAGLRRPRPDVIYACSTPPSVGWLGRLLARWHGCPWCFEVIDVWPQVPIGMGLIRSRLLAALLHAATDPLYRSARCVITLSEGMRRQIAERPTAPPLIHVIENGTQTDRFRPAPEDSHVLRLVYAGAVGRANGLEALAVVARRVLARRSGVRFEVCGWGSHWQALAEVMADEAGFCLLPAKPKDELAIWLRGAAVGLCVFAPHPVLEANSANKFFDYLAAGLPVVLNYGGWQAELVEEAGCGRWVPAGDLEAWERVLLELIDAPDLRRRLGVAARRLACERFDRRFLAAQALERVEAACQPVGRVK